MVDEPDEPATVLVVSYILDNSNSPNVYAPLLPVAAAAAPVEVERKYELMQLDWQDAYFWVSTYEPLPWGH